MKGTSRGLMDINMLNYTCKLCIHLDSVPVSLETELVETKRMYSCPARHITKNPVIFLPYLKFHMNTSSFFISNWQVAK